MANKNGRNRSRLHVQFGERDYKVCVSSEVSLLWKQNLAGSIKEYLESHSPNGGKKKLMDGGATSVTVKFVLGKAATDLGIRPIDVTLREMRRGQTDKLFKRINEAETAARRQLGLAEIEVLKEVS